MISEKRALTGCGRLYAGQVKEKIIGILYNFENFIEIFTRSPICEFNNEHVCHMGLLYSHQTPSNVDDVGYCSPKIRFIYLRWVHDCRLFSEQHPDIDPSQNLCERVMICR